MCKFRPNPEVDAAVSSLAVRCPGVDRASGTACRWTGRFEDFKNHQHVFDDQQQQQQPGTEESRGRKRPRSDDGEMDEDEVDNAQVPPPLKVSRLGGLSVRIFGYRLQIDRSGIHFHAGTDNSSNTPAPDPSTEATAPTTEHP